MNRLKNFRFTLLGTLLIVIAMPTVAAPKPGPDNDCDGISTGDMTLVGKLTVQGISKLTDCSTQIEASGTTILTAREAGSGLATGKVAGVEATSEADVQLTIVITTFTDATGKIHKGGMVKGNIQVNHGSALRNKPDRVQVLDFSGMLDESGQIVGVMEGKKGLNAVNVRNRIVMASVLGELVVGDKEIAMSTKHRYVGTVTIVK